MDYFLIEMVNTLRASSAVASARAKRIEREMVEAGLIPSPASAPALPSIKKDASDPRDSLTSLTSRSPAGKASAIEEEEEAIRVRLEAIGRHVGANYTERCVST